MILDDRRLDIHWKRVENGNGQREMNNVGCVILERGQTYLTEINDIINMSV